MDKLFGLSILRHHGKRLCEHDPRGVAYHHRQQAALAAATAAGGQDFQSLAPGADVYDLLSLAVAGPASTVAAPAACNTCDRTDYS